MMTKTFTGSYGKRCNKATYFGPLFARVGGLDRFRLVAEDEEIRFFTVKELLALHGYPSGFTFPESYNIRECFCLVGNSVSVDVIAELVASLDAVKPAPDRQPAADPERPGLQPAEPHPGQPGVQPGQQPARQAAEEPAGQEAVQSFALPIGSRILSWRLGRSIADCFRPCYHNFQIIFAKKDTP